MYYVSIACLFFPTIFYPKVLNPTHRHIAWNKGYQTERTIDNNYISQKIHQFR